MINNKMMNTGNRGHSPVDNNVLCLAVTPDVIKKIPVCYCPFFQLLAAKNDLLQSGPGRQRPALIKV